MGFILLFETQRFNSQIYNNMFSSIKLIKKKRFIPM